MARAVISHIVLLAAVFALTGCEKGAGALSDKAATGASEPAPKAQKSTRLVDRDVEAPEVFQTTDDALWDGRPSLGGVWVASPDTKDPERVIMRNPANGKFVIGALFRRERDNPGPTLQISSDAAAALGILAGAPAKLSVTALRREEAPEEAPTSPILDTAETVAGAESVATGAIDGGGVETKPLDAVPAGEQPAKKGKKTKKVVETEAIASAALDAAAPGSKPAASVAPAPAPAPAAASAPASAGGRPIQIGIFSVEANAKRAVDTLAKSGIPAELRKESAKGKTFWSVIARGDAATLQKVKAAGFADAYLLK